MLHLLVRLVKEKEWLDLGPVSRFFDDWGPAAEMHFRLDQIDAAIHQRYGKCPFIIGYEPQIGDPARYGASVKPLDGTPPI